MFSIKLIVGFAVLAGVYAEPPRKRFNFRFGARQEAAVDDAAAANPPASQGYNYEAPAERLRLPIKFRQFARQEDASAGYNYPKPTNGYGVPEESEPTDVPTTEYGTPETGTDYNEDTTTDNPEAERLRGIQASQLRRKNAKLSRNPSARLITGDVRFQQQVQPAVYYIQYPSADLIEPQYVYHFK